MYICRNKNENDMKIELTQALKSAKNQLDYTISCLSFDLENWERKEYEQVKTILIREVESLENRIEFLINN
jgi:hypothetical protein